MREGLSTFIESLDGFQMAWTSGNAGEALRKAGEDLPDVMLVDITLPDRNGLELIKDLHALYPRLAMMVISMHDEKLYVQRALRAGARGYLPKDAPHSDYEKALRRVAAGGLSVSESMAEEILLSYAGGHKYSDRGGLESLSDRELEVFQQLGEGLSTHDVARQLKISPKTVDVHKMNIRAKLSLEDGAAVTRRAIQWTEARRHGSV